jgi:RNA polymerase sigma-70 factor (ECF subfamily)
MADDAPASGLMELYRLHRTEILRFLVARTGNQDEADDIVQELWLKASNVMPGPIANGRAYLFRMAQNLVLDRVRERKRREQREQAWVESETGPHSPTSEVADPARTTLDVLEEQDEVARLAGAIETLPEGARRVFQMHKIEGLSHSEVAARLAISKSAVEKHMAVAMKYLRRAMAD